MIELLFAVLGMSVCVLTSCPTSQLITGVPTVERLSVKSVNVTIT